MVYHSLAYPSYRVLRKRDWFDVVSHDQSLESGNGVQLVDRELSRCRGSAYLHESQSQRPRNPNPPQISKFPSFKDPPSSVPPMPQPR
jgi:hypothetical protein